MCQQQSFIDVESEYNLECSQVDAGVLPMWLRPFVRKLEKAVSAYGTDEVTEGDLICFESVDVPNITIEKYVQILWAEFREPIVWSATVLYLERFIDTGLLPLTPCTVHRVLLTALSVGCHKTTPGGVSVGTIAEPGGVDADDLATMVQIFAKVIDYNFYATIDTLQQSLLSTSPTQDKALNFAAALISVPKSQSNSASSSIGSWIASVSDSRRSSDVSRNSSVKSKFKSLCSRIKSKIEKI
eukprot:TRINITY_DN9793_c0_g1_i1.p1 TRINITY_DN9793_c0_g1~~TRINITY_DN9793_c0_g1_i1.p1  ORF type:complete len:242 (+),score=53.26 TRINITY_DN9793_c0_g1_i1:75-800(+)